MSRRKLRTRADGERVTFRTFAEPGLFLLPFFIGLLVFTVYPFINVILLSFRQDYSLMTGEFSGIGLGNYAEIFHDANFLNGLRNTALYVLFVVPIVTVLSLFLASLLNSCTKLQGLFQTCYFLPMVTSVTAVGLVWKWMFNYDYGLINYALSLFGVSPVNWLNDPHYNLAALIIYGIWSMLPFTIILLLSGFQNINPQYYTAARIDGASSGRIFRRITVPLLARWQKRSVKHRETVSVIPCNPVPSRPGMEERVRVKLGMVDGACYAVTLPRGAGTVTSLSRADAVITVESDREGLDAGQPVQAELLRSREEIEGALLATGSHDNTLDLIDSMLRRKHPGFRLTSAHVGSLGGLLALRRGQCHLAGSHLLDEETGIYNRKAIQEHMKGMPVMLVQLVDREQGIMVLPGNPRHITSFEDLCREDVQFINRQRGSGTRVLLDYELKKRGLSPARIQGYRDEEYTHMNVAAAVLSGRADAGLGVRSAAAALGLEFISVGVEEYDLVIPSRYAQDPRILALFDVIRSDEFKESVRNMGGYGTSRTGEILWEYDGK